MIKEIIKKIIEFRLKILAKLILAKYKPEVVGITGSVGKTSTKEAIYTVLAAKFNTRRNVKNYNNEIGVPLTIIGTDSPGKNIIGWIGVFLKAVKLILIRDKNYPKILVIEMGVDRPGDMKYLNSIVKCKIGVITLIGPVHLEFFNSIEAIAKEKSELIKPLARQAWAVLNYDDERTRKTKTVTQAKILTYGFDQSASVRAQELSFSFIDKDKNKISEVTELAGVSFKLSYHGSAVPVLLPNIIGYGVVYSALASAAVGLIYEMNLVDIAKALRDFKSPRGRMSLIKGVKNTLIIDDSYNSSPQSSIAALDMVDQIPLAKGARKFAVLGDMLELGSASEQGHREVGQYVVKRKIDKLIVVGERARDIARGAKAAGMLADNIFNFAQAEAAGKFVQDRIQQSDLILVKGSQGIRMEKIVKEIMAEPMQAKELLVRQDGLWIHR